MAINTEANWGVVGENDGARSSPADNNDEKDAMSQEKHVERSDDMTSDSENDNLVYDDADDEPELHARTYIALAAMFVLNLVQVFALQGPPAVVSTISRF